MTEKVAILGSGIAVERASRVLAEIGVEVLPIEDAMVLADEEVSTPLIEEKKYFIHAPPKVHTPADAYPNNRKGRRQKERDEKRQLKKLSRR